MRLNKQLCSLLEEKNMLLQIQLSSKPCLQLVHTGLPVFTPYCTPFSSARPVPCL